MAASRLARASSESVLDARVFREWKDGEKRRFDDADGVEGPGMLVSAGGTFASNVDGLGDKAATIAASRFARCSAVSLAEVGARRVGCEEREGSLRMGGDEGAMRPCDGKGDGVREIVGNFSSSAHSDVRHEITVCVSMQR